MKIKNKYTVEKTKLGIFSALKVSIIKSYISEGWQDYNLNVN